MALRLIAPRLFGCELVVVLLIFCLLLPSCVSSSYGQSATDLVSLAKTVVGPLTSMDGLVLGEIDEAISKGNDALRDRLEQLHGIIQEALATANQILKSRIEQLDSATQNRMAQALRGTMDLANKFSADYRQGIHEADAALAARTLQFQQEVGQIVAASTPFNFDPLINVDTERGITTVRGEGDYTTLLLSGVSLFKKGTAPQAFLLLKPNPSALEWLQYRTGLRQDAIRPVEVIAPSMGLIQLRIKNVDIPVHDPPAPLLLELDIRSGGTIFADIVSPRFPLRVCNALPHYHAHLTVTASGEVWETREIPLPGSKPTKGYPAGFYLDTCGRNDCNAHLDICTVASEGFEVDETPIAGYSAGLRYGHTGGDGKHEITPDQPRPGCVRIYVDGSGSPPNVWIADVYERQRRKIDAEPCTKLGANASLSLVYGGWREAEANLQDAVGSCAAPGLSKTPEIRYRLKIDDDAHREVWITDLTPDALARSEDGRFEAKVSSSGLLSAVANPSCRWAFEGAVQK